jgi:hypothetical protein
MTHNTPKLQPRFAIFRQKLVVRVWNLAKRLDPKTMKEEKKKKDFSKLGNK